jgi:hypothetical protein
MAYAGPTYVGASTGVGGTGAVSPDFSASGRTAGDWLILAVVAANQAITAPAGWTEVPTVSPQSQGTAAAIGGIRLAVFTKVSNGTETTVSVADSGDHTYAAGLVVRPSGTATELVIHKSAGKTAAAGTAHTANAVTTTIANALIVNIFGTDRDSAGPSYSALTNAGLTNLTERHDAGTTSGVGSGIMLATGEKETAGAVSATASTSAASVVYNAITLAFVNVTPWTWTTRNLTAAFDAFEGTGYSNGVMGSISGQPVSGQTLGGFVSNGPFNPGSGNIDVYFSGDTSAFTLPDLTIGGTPITFSTARGVYNGSVTSYSKLATGFNFTASNVYSIAAGSTAVSGTGSASGVAAVTGQGSAVGSGAGSSGGAGTAAGTGLAIGAASGAASATGAVAGAASSIARGVGTSNGAAQVLGSGDELSTLTGNGSAGGSAAVQGAGQAIVRTDGTANGTGAASGSGEAPMAAAGAAQGAAEALGAGASTWSAIGTALGLSTVSGQAGSFARASGESVGSANAQGAGAAVATGNGAVSGAAFTSGVADDLSTRTGDGSASGEGQVAGQGAAIVVAQGAAISFADVEGRGAAVAEAVGGVVGTADAHGVGGDVSTAIGQAAGAAAVSGQGKGDTSEGNGEAAGGSTVTGVGHTVIGSTGSCAGFSLVIGRGAALYPASPGRTANDNRPERTSATVAVSRIATAARPRSAATAVTSRTAASVRQSR